MSGRIAFQGELGAYSHQACAQARPDFTPVPCQTFEDVVEMTRSGAVDLGMLAVENSTYGRVADVHSLLPKAGLHIVDEAFVRVHVNLLGVKGAALADVRGVIADAIKTPPSQADIDRVTAIWRECLQRYGGPYLFGKTPTTADAMYTPVCSRFATYDVKLDPAAAAYRDLMLRFPAMLEWTAAAKAEPEEVEELDVEF